MYEQRELYKKYPKIIKEVSTWLKQYPIPPKLYQVKGLTMYRNENINYQNNITDTIKNDFNKVEKEKSSKKNERINNIMNNVKKEPNYKDFYLDLSQFKFCIDDKVLFDNKFYKVVNCTDAVILIKLIEEDAQLKKKKLFPDKNFAKKNIYDKEKNCFMVETHNYKLRIQELSANCLI